jgi:hypothetical protein
MPDNIAFYYRGMIERPSKRGYRWHYGYSANSDDGNPLYPWNTKAECKAYAKAQGKQASFISEKG